MTDPHAQANAPNDAQRASADAARLAAEMRRLHRLISSRVLLNMQDELQGHELSFTQMTVMHQLRAQAPLTVTALAERARLSLPAMSHLVERLVRRGLAERRENPGNRREKLVALTAQGQDIVNRMDAQFIGAYETAFSGVRPGTIRAAADAVRALVAEVGPGPDCTPPSQENP
ncbi:MarR family winged helix-turn-helix transcriptional regulator [Deinococcus aestuarii]|uniref:MarR family winged helix-turn-helix transcriptional regulator n=1 Tax=Deinococcus aestuarii TaxID=2774531 RepID=UPI001C0C62F0|nr:MarR family transcriptional regulator [Deinococcus aestuarii]